MPYYNCNGVRLLANRRSACLRTYEANLNFAHTDKSVDDDIQQQQSHYNVQNVTFSSHEVKCRPLDLKLTQSGPWFRSVHDLHAVDHSRYAADCSRRLGGTRGSGQRTDDILICAIE